MGGCTGGTNNASLTRLFKDPAMQFAECNEGAYRIYVGALEAPQGDGYIAALVVEHTGSSSSERAVVHRDESLACGHRWASAEEAIAYAVARGRDFVRRRTVVAMA
jgi:hypothetical protein